MHARFRRARPWRLLADASGSKRRAWGATEWGGLPGGRGPAVPEAGALELHVLLPRAGMRESSWRCKKPAELVSAGRDREITD